MRSQITHVSIHQTSKVFALVYFWFGAIYNFLAARVGGVEFESVDRPGESRI